MARALFAFAVAALLSVTVMAHVRLRYADNGALLRWANPSNIPIVVNVDGSEDVSDGSHETAILNAIEAWNAATGAGASIAPQYGASAKERRDWQSDDIHLVVFDENNSSGYFSGASGIVAITPITFFTDGRIVDADIVFNGKNFRFTTSGESTHFDIQDVATHELGHFIGLDHSGVCGATMYPYVDSTVILHRSLSIDDRNGLRDIYPAGSFARITGSVKRTDGSAVSGAHVVALDQSGHVAGATLSAAGGQFSMEGLDAGSYSVYADPLDQPVSNANLGGGRTIETNFSTTVLGNVTVASGATASLGQKTLEADTTLSLGRVSDDYPLRVIIGEPVSRSVRGTGLITGSTLMCSDPTLALDNVSFTGNSVQFRVTTPAGAETGHVDLTVEDPSGARDTLVGGLEITPADPMLFTSVPALGDPSGGTEVTITGQYFRPGSRVVIGNRIYRDGDPTGGCQVVDPGTIRLTTNQTIGGSHDVVVIDPSGVEGRLENALVVDIPPSLSTVFPSVGSNGGGTVVTLSGRNFTPDMWVEIDGAVQSDVLVESPTRLRVVTAPAPPGGPHVLRVVNPRGLSAESAFTYVAEHDPEITLVTPDEVDRSGGVPVSIYGAGFNEDTRIVFGANTRTGLGGTAAETRLVEPDRLEVVAPSSGVGTTSIMAKNTLTGQAVTLSAGFTFTGSESSGESGGCAALPPGIGPKGPPTWRGLLSGGGWFLLALLLAWIRTQRVSAQGQAVPPQPATALA